MQVSWALLALLVLAVCDTVRHAAAGYGDQVQVTVQEKGSGRKFNLNVMESATVFDIKKQYCNKIGAGGKGLKQVKCYQHALYKAMEGAVLEDSARLASSGIRGQQTIYVDEQL